MIWKPPILRQSLFVTSNFGSYDWVSLTPGVDEV